MATKRSRRRARRRHAIAETAAPASRSIHSANRLVSRYNGSGADIDGAAPDPPGSAVHGDGLDVGNWPGCDDPHQIWISAERPTRPPVTAPTHKNISPVRLPLPP